MRNTAPKRSVARSPKLQRYLAAAAVFGLFLTAMTAAGSDGIAVQVRNDGTDDIVVTVYDMSKEPAAVVLAHARINGFTTVPISAQPDASGHAKLSWTATTADPVARKCGHATNVVLLENAELTVRADAACSA